MPPPPPLSAEQLIPEQMSPEQLSAEQLSAEQLSAEQNVAGANVSEHLSRSICRIFRSICRGAFVAFFGAIVGGAFVGGAFVMEP